MTTNEAMAAPASSQIISNAKSNVAATTTTSKKVSTPTLHKFASFPAEIRILVWEFAIANEKGRTVELKKKKRGKRQPIMVCITAAPALLHVNSESRSETINKMGATLMRISNFPFTPFFFNNDLDTLRIPSLELKNWRLFNFISVDKNHLTAALNGDFENTIKPINLVKRVVIDVSGLKGFWDCEDIILDCVREFLVLDILRIETNADTVDEYEELHKEMVFDAKNTPLQGWHIDRVPDFDVVLKTGTYGSYIVLFFFGTCF